ncbi:MAG: undecaprenyl-diphosphatase UppP [Candidatus Komeilibacteria bacterium]
MVTLYIIFSSLIQSITEFIPVSSSGHLIIWHHFISSPLNEIQYDIILHAGSLLALLFYFRKDVVRLIKGWFLSFRGEHNQDSRLAWLLIISTIPAAVIGFFLEDLIVNIFRATYWVVGMLIIIGFVMMLAEKYAEQKKTVKELTIRHAICLGLWQCLAFIPGTSRSGITIIAGMFLKLKRAEAARYSFLLAIPTLLGASLRGFSMVISEGMTMNTIIIQFVALVITFVFSIFVIKFFLNYLQQHSLYPFAWYRIVLALLLVLVLNV